MLVEVFWNGSNWDARWVSPFAGRRGAVLPGPRKTRRCPALGPRICYPANSLAFFLLYFGVWDTRDEKRQGGGSSKIRYKKNRNQIALIYSYCKKRNLMQKGICTTKWKSCHWIQNFATKSRPERFDDVLWSGWWVPPATKIVLWLPDFPKLACIPHNANWMPKGFPVLYSTEQFMCLPKGKRDSFAKSINLQRSFCVYYYAIYNILFYYYFRKECHY